MIIREALIDKITKYALNNASELFSKFQGGFYPFAIIMDSDENINPYYLDENEFHDSAEVVECLFAEVNDHVHKFNSSGGAICYQASKKIEDFEFDLIVLEIFLPNPPLEEKFYFVIEINKQNHTFEVYEKIDYSTL